MPQGAAPDMSTAPTVSIIVPAYNAARWLRETIDSVLAQTYPDFELVIVDDASTDDTVAIARDTGDPRVRVIESEKNAGAAISRNVGIEAARGEYLAFLDADDIALPQRIERQVSFLERHPDVGLCGSWLQTIGARRDVWTAYRDHDHIKAELLFRSGLLGGTVMCRRSLLMAHGLRYDPAYPISEDYDLWTRCADVMRLANLQEVLLLYRLHGANTTFRFGDQIPLRNRGILLRQIAKLGIDPSEDELELHCALADHGPTGPATLGLDLDAVERWLIRLREGNRRSGYVTDAALRILVYEYWRRCSMSGSASKGARLWRFATSSAMAGIPRKWLIRDAVKMVLGLPLYPLPR